MENIMLRDSHKKHIKIIDFGLSNWYSDKNPQTHCGSPEYAAPELFYEGRIYGPEVDLWSLGVILYAMLAGKLPFVSPRNARTSAEEWREKLMNQIFRGLTAQQEKKIAGVSNDYKDLVKRLLQLQPHKRIPMWQICRHPWINNAAAKNAASTSGHRSQRVFEPAELLAITEEICAATKMDSTTIEKELRDVRCGDTTGMFNIIGHRIRGNGSADVFGTSSVTSRRPSEIRRTRSDSLALKTADKGGIDLSKELKKLSTIDNPLRSASGMRNLYSLQSLPTRSEDKKSEDQIKNRRLEIGRKITVKSAGKSISSGAVSVRPMTQPPLLRSALARKLSSSLSKTSNDSRSRPSCPGPSFTTRDTCFAQQDCKTADRRIFMNEAPVKSATIKRYEHRKIRPQSLEITSELLERVKTFSRPSATLDRRQI